MRKLLQTLLSRRVWFAVFVTAAPLWAVEAVEEAGGGAESPFAGNVGNALWTLIIFVGVVIVLGKFAWKPILAQMQERENFIRDSLLDAKNERLAAEAQLKEYNDKLAEAHGEVAAIIDEARRDAGVTKQRIEEEAREEAERIIIRARREVSIATDEAIKEIYSLTTRLATDVASRIVEREIDPRQQEQLIQESIDELRNLPPQG